jgi:hypothetical protein
VSEKKNSVTIKLQSCNEDKTEYEFTCKTDQNELPFEVFKKIFANEGVGITLAMPKKGGGDG